MSCPLFHTSGTKMAIRTQPMSVATSSWRKTCYITYHSLSTQETLRAEINLLDTSMCVRHTRERPVYDFTSGASCLYTVTSCISSVTATNLVGHVLRGSTGVDQLEVSVRVLDHGSRHEAANATETVDTAVHRHGELAGASRPSANSSTLEGARGHKGRGGPSQGHSGSSVHNGSHDSIQVNAEFLGCRETQRRVAIQGGRVHSSPEARLDR